MSNRIDADVPPASVRRTAVQRDVDPDESTVCRHYGKLRRFGHDRGVGSNSTFHERTRSDAAKLLVHHCGDHELAVRERIGGEGGRGTHRRHPALHVRCPATINAAVQFHCVEWCVPHPLDADDVEMPIEHQGVRAGFADTSHDVRPSRRDLVKLDAETPCGEHVAQHMRYRALAGAAGNERRVARVRPYERAREAYGVSSFHSHAVRPCSSIVNETISPNSPSAARRSCPRSVRAMARTHPPPDAPVAFAPSPPARCTRSTIASMRGVGIEG